MLLQGTFDDLGTPLSEITFCVVDLETTGGSAIECAITEVGAIKVRRGEVQGTFETLVNPGHPVPAFVRLLTGLSDEMLAVAPPIERVLPSWLEFSRNTVLVAHNARFDVSFLNAALMRAGYEAMTNRVVDTAALARKTLAGEVPNNKLATLVRYLRCSHQPTHRAYADALATTDVLHHLIERASGWGVTTLEDLLALTFTRMDSTMSKIKLTEELPSKAGIYRFLAAGNRTLYVGKASDIRARVRSYFYGDPRRKIRNLLRETQSITFETHPNLLEAEVDEARAIVQEIPPYNRAGKKQGAWYVKLALKKHVRLSTVRSPKNDGALYIGPFSGQRTARLLVDAVQSATGMHRCTDPRKCSGSAHDQMGTCVADDVHAQRTELRLLATALAVDPCTICDRLAARLRRLARQERFEEAEELRRSAALLERVLRTNLEIRALLEARSVVLRVGTRLVLIEHGRLVAACDVDGNCERGVRALLERGQPEDPVGRYVTPVVDKEARVILAWLRKHAHEARLMHVDRAWAQPLGSRPGNRFEPRPAPTPAG